jgi:succinate dehydrogenase/fumarate reductase flavoprotein subunit
MMSSQTVDEASTLDADLLVIGGGMAGLTGAARAATDGARVVLVEKGPAIGGSALYAGFVWTAESYDTMREVNPDGDPALARVVVDGLQDGLEWIRSLGVSMRPPVVVLGYGRGCETDLAGYIAACAARIRESGSLITDATTERLIVEDGAVRGAIVHAGGRQITIRSSATLLATGGFEHIHPLARSLALRANPYSAGDGLRLASAAGAAFAGEGAGFYGHLIPSGVAYDKPHEFVSLTFYHSEHGILVNLDGERFCDETLGDHLNALAVLAQKDARALLICDERVHQQWMLTPYVEGVEAPDKFRLAYNRGARAAIAHELDELEALPEEWGYSGPAALRTLKAFNAQAAGGAPSPGRRLDCEPLTEPPYYVIEVVPAITNTWGGLRVDADARVLDEDGAPIPGLLAAGSDIGGLYVRAYGGGLAAGLTFGLRAAHTAATAVRQS